MDASAKLQGKSQRMKKPPTIRVWSLSGKIFRTVLAFTVTVMVAMSLALTSIYYLSYEADAERDLAAQARDAATYLNATPSEANVPALEEQFSGLVRYTLIAPDGSVLFDSSTPDASQMENHASRPEVRAAEEVGEGAVSRYSTTAQTDTIYAAVKLDDGSIIRLSETRDSLLAFLGDLMLPVLLAVLVAVVLVLALSRILTARIMKPINALDFSDPLENEIYSEMAPLLFRIDQQQQQLKAQNRELAQAESMRRDFSANVSHEMKTPLQVISGYAELMKSGMVDPADTKRFAGLIYDESQTMRQLINDVLTLSRLDDSSVGAVEPARIDLCEVAARVAARLSLFAKERNVQVSVSGSGAFIEGNATLVEEMIYNLIENGIRYNVRGGQVRFEAEHDAEANEVVVCVSDTGQGIPAEEHEKIFERFYRMEKSRSKETGGTGLGLAIVKHTVLQHGGRIELKSKMGEGAVFVLRFPAA